MSNARQTRLRELRKSSGYSQEDIAEKLNISTSAYGFYEQGKTIPNADTISFLADLYDVTTDYILGKSNHPKLTRRHERDIEKDLEDMKKQLEDGTLMMDLEGQQIDEEIMQFIIDNMENTLTLAKLKANEKFGSKNKKPKK